MPESAQEVVACPWCWKPQPVEMCDGKVVKHDDGTLDDACRGSGKTLDDVAQADAIARMCRRLLVTAGYADWAVRWSSAAPSICHTDSKQIWMYDRRVNDDLWYYIKEAFIHEMAHIDTWTTQGMNDEQGHGPAFFRRYGELLVELADVVLEIEEGADA